MYEALVVTGAGASRFKAGNLRGIGGRPGHPADALALARRFPAIPASMLFELGDLDPEQLDHGGDVSVRRQMPFGDGQDRLEAGRSPSAIASITPCWGVLAARWVFLRGRRRPDRCGRARRHRHILPAAPFRPRAVIDRRPAGLAEAGQGQGDHGGGDARAAGGGDRLVDVDAGGLRTRPSARRPAAWSRRTPAEPTADVARAGNVAAAQPGAGFGVAPLGTGLRRGRRSPARGGSPGWPSSGRSSGRCRPGSVG